MCSAGGEAELPREPNRPSFAHDQYGGLTHVKNVRRKVEDRSTFRYIDTVRGVGYRFRDR